MRTARTPRKSREAASDVGEGYEAEHRSQAVGHELLALTGLNGNQTHADGTTADEAGVLDAVTDYLTSAG